MLNNEVDAAKNTDELKSSTSILRSLFPKFEVRECSQEVALTGFVEAHGGAQRHNRTIDSGKEDKLLV